MAHVHNERLKELEEIAAKLRFESVQMVINAGSGHVGGPLGMADIFTALYFEVLKHDPKKPDWEERDRVILSNGHICPIQYAAMAYSGYFPAVTRVNGRSMIADSVRPIISVDTSGSSETAKIPSHLGSLAAFLNSS